MDSQEGWEILHLAPHTGEKPQMALYVFLPVARSLWRRYPQGQYLMHLLHSPYICLTHQARKLLHFDAS